MGRLSSQHPLDNKDQPCRKVSGSACEDEPRGSTLNRSSDSISSRRLLKQSNQIQHEVPETQVAIQDFNQTGRASTAWRRLQCKYTLLRVRQSRKTEQKLEPQVFTRRGPEVKSPPCCPEEGDYGLLDAPTSFFESSERLLEHASPIDEKGTSSRLPGRRLGFLHWTRAPKTTAPPPNDLFTHVLSVLEPHDIAHLVRVTLPHILMIGEEIYRQRTASGQLGEREHWSTIGPFMALSGSRKERICAAYAVMALKEGVSGSVL
jgi:hypothetical protein